MRFFLWSRVLCKVFEICKLFSWLVELNYHLNLHANSVFEMNTEGWFWLCIDAWWVTCTWVVPPDYC